MLDLKILDMSVMKKIDTFTQKKFLCSTHPHNLYLEILSETGLIGFVIFFSFIIIFLKFSLNHLNKVNLNIKPYLIGSISLILVYLWPLKSSGSIFSTFTASFFWFNIGMILFYTKIKKK